MTSFEELLNQEADTAYVRPPTPPVGTWNAYILDYEQYESDKKKTPGIRCTVQLDSPGDDVDAGEMENYELERQQAGVEHRKLLYTFWLTQGAGFMLTEFMEACGISLTGRTIKDCLTELPGKAVRVYVKHTPSNKPGDDSVFAEISTINAA